MRKNNEFKNVMSTCQCETVNTKNGIGTIVLARNYKVIWR